MAIQNEMWKPEIIEGLYKSNEFLLRSYNADEYVVGGRVVHIPQAAAAPAITRNRSSYPATAVVRADTDITYTLDEYTTAPTHIPNADTVELSYDKRSSIIRENMGTIKEYVANDFITNWAAAVPAGNTILATGAVTVGANLAPGATGSRRIITEADIRKARVALGNMSVPNEGRVMVITEEMLDQLMSIDALRFAFQQTVNLKEGSIGRLYSFDVYVRSTVGAQTTGGTTGVPKFQDAATAATDDVFALFYHEDCVERALGEVKMFEQMDNPLYYGDLYSFLIRAKGRNRRSDNKGIVKLVCREV
jgi:hypothetical protein